MRNQSKNAIAMIMAIVVIVIIGTIMALSMNMTMLTTKRNLDMYLSEQIEILADSAREYAMYKIGNTSCVVSGYNIPGEDTFYDINISILYVTATGCADTALDFTSDTDANLQRDTAVIDVAIAIDKSKTNTTENIRFYKRYIENIKP